MKILVISTWFPLPPDNGSRMRTYNLLRQLGAEHTLDLLTLSQTERDADHLTEVQKFCRRVAVFPEPQFNPGAMRSWLGFFSPTPRYFQAHHSQELEALMTRWTREETYDAVLAITLGAAPYAAKLDIPLKVLDQHNVESQVIKRKSQNEKSPIRRLRYMPTWIKTERFERGIASRFDAISVVSHPERELMRTLLKNGHRDCVHVIPNGVDPALLEYPSPGKEDGLLVLNGALTYQPNRDAAECLCREILPRVQARFPQAHVRITGGLKGVKLGSLRDIPGVEFTGYVDDIRRIVASACALVVPLKFGGGTRLKILEAMALGTPVVSTSVGAEGIDVTDGEDILLGETTDELADRTVRLLADPHLAERIAENARALVRDRYQWPAIAEKFTRIFGPS